MFRDVGNSDLLSLYVHVLWYARATLVRNSRIDKPNDPMTRVMIRGCTRRDTRRSRSMHFTATKTDAHTGGDTLPGSLRGARLISYTGVPPLRFLAFGDPVDCNGKYRG
jgi:hypothetical protein